MTDPARGQGALVPPRTVLKVRPAPGHTLSRRGGDRRGGFMVVVAVCGLDRMRRRMGGVLDLRGEVGTVGGDGRETYRQWHAPGLTACSAPRPGRTDLSCAAPVTGSSAPGHELARGGKVPRSHHVGGTPQTAPERLPRRSYTWPVQASPGRTKGETVMQMEVPVWILFVLLGTHGIAALAGYIMGKPDPPKKEEGECEVQTPPGRES